MPGYAVMLFETHRLQVELRGKNAKSVVVRPRAFPTNPFWPYVDDLELVFFGGLIAGGIAAGWRSYRKKRHSFFTNLDSADYLLTRFAYSLPRAMKLLGDFEEQTCLAIASKRSRLTGRCSSLDLPARVQRFCSPRLHSCPSSGTHRYSDFPFLFIPIAWNRLQDRAGQSGTACGTPASGPHQDHAGQSRSFRRAATGRTFSPAFTILAGYTD